MKMQKNKKRTDWVEQSLKKYRSMTSKGEITTLNFHTLFIKISQIYPPTMSPFPLPDNVQSFTAMTKLRLSLVGLHT